jgi:biotin carboxyl carrier protein
MTQDELLSLLDRVLTRLKPTDVTDLSLACGDMSLRVRRGRSARDGVPQEEATPARGDAPPLPSSAFTVKAPLVGTFYAAPGPGRPPFAVVGATVSKGDTLCIVEAMKAMNEIEAERSGRVTQVLAQNGDLVEFGQPLFEMEAL